VFGGQLTDQIAYVLSNVVIFLWVIGKLTTKEIVKVTRLLQVTKLDKDKLIGT
jgi:enamine deaminase RidA (YjgF/YER057c/UK114 family)